MERVHYDHEISSGTITTGNGAALVDARDRFPSYPTIQRQAARLRDKRESTQTDPPTGHPEQENDSKEKIMNIGQLLPRTGRVTQFATGFQR